ncbi:MAG: hypothetical protein LBD37_06600 [Treponema sp.]|jgi:uncharacterized Zn-binding protein involved in type VI secretion|nr:hypothetical protein [Treponema sp.]
MPTPIATIVNMTGTADVAVGPGAVKYLFKGLPCACLGDAVAGPLCVSGVITMTTAINKIFMGRPVANMGSLVTGVSPLGVPVATALTVCHNVNILI